MFHLGGVAAVRATEEVEDFMDGRRLREGLDDLLAPAPKESVADTTDDERELVGRPRPPRGSGWWGTGRPVETLRKGIARPIVDGGGLCSPGRWPLHRRNLPQSPLVAELRNILWKGYLECTATFENKDARRQLMKVACGHCVGSPSRAHERNLCGRP